MKIIVITSSYPRHQGDGVGSFVHSLSQCMVRLGHQVTVLAPYEPSVSPDWPLDVDVRRVRYIWPDSWALLGHARSLDGDTRLRWHAYPLVILFGIVAVFRLWSDVLRQHADVIYAQWLLPGGLVGAIVSRLSSVPLIVSLHGSDVFVAERYGIFGPAVRFIFRTACHTIACSSDLAHRAVNLGLLPEHITVVPYGVDPDRYFPAPQAAQVLRTELSIPESSQVVMAMGRLVHKKGFTYLLRAVPLVLARCANTRFVIAGEGDLCADLEALAESLHIQNHIVFAGYVPWDRTPEYMAMTDVFVVPSIVDEAGNVDGLPNVLLESMASGCAVVASRVAGIPEVLEDGKSGLLVPQKDERALANAICALLSSSQLRHRLGGTARAKVISQLSWTHTAQRVAAILQSCVRERG